MTYKKRIPSLLVYLYLRDGFISTKIYVHEITARKVAQKQSERPDVIKASIRDMSSERRKFIGTYKNGKELT
jgi:hypothetical protein